MNYRNDTIHNYSDIIFNKILDGEQFLARQQLLGINFNTIEITS